ncbi:MAG: hypothetical protein EA398_14075 [Deltaproteobacteria bacterium]|nr:MAG: hypothetical protein EA398_14075 [Deltaproteobacteria bacterium]
MIPSPERLPISAPPGFRIEGLLSRGGMGSVYRASRENDATPIALKALRHLRPEHVDALLREVRFLSRIEHPGVVRILDHGDGPDGPWYAMERIDGPTLRHWIDDTHRRSAPGGRPVADDARDTALRHLRRNLRSLTGGDRSRTARLDDHPGPPAPRDHTPLTPTSAIPTERIRSLAEIASRIGLALTAIHAAGVVHRDLKPDNILLRDGRTPVIVDFGIGVQVLAGDRADAATATRLRGTLHYIAPEALRGLPIDGRADLYALGCILFEALTGRTPFDGEDSRTLMRQHIDEIPVPVRSLSPALPPAFASLVDDLLHKDPARRPAYAVDVVHRLVSARLVGPCPLPPTTYLNRNRLYGRAEHTRTLQRLCKRIDEGRVGGIIVRGDSGSGKTRLVADTLQRAGRRGFLVAVAVAGERGVHSGHRFPDAPFRVLRTLLRQLVGPTLDRDPALRQTLLGEGGRALAALDPDLAELLEGVPPWPAERPEGFRAALLLDVAALLINLSRTTPTILVIDDVQWADEPSIELLHDLLQQAGDARFGIVATARPDGSNHALEGLTGHHAVQVLQLPLLEDRDVVDLASSMLDGAPIPDTLASLLQRRAAGSPLLVVETVRALIADGTLVRSGPGRWGVSASRQGSLDGAIPRGMTQLTLERLASLRPNQRELLELAAAIGMRIDTTLLAGAAQLPRTRVEELLDDLRVTGWLEPSSMRDTLAFQHARRRDAVYENIAPETRRRLHGAVAAALTSTIGEEPAPAHATLAQHLELAGVAESAADAWSQAAEYAIARAAWGDARTALERASRLTTDPERRVGWQLLQVRAIDIPTRLYDAALERLDDCERILDSHPNEPLAIDAGLLRLEVLGATMRNREGLALGLELIERARAIDDQPRLVLAQALATRHAASSTRTELAQDLIREAMEGAEQVDDLTVRAEVLRTHASQVRFFDRVRQEPEVFAQAAEALLEDERPVAAAWLLLNNVAAMIAAGDLDRARWMFEEGRAIHNRAHPDHTASASAYADAVIAHAEGRFTLARQRLDRIIHGAAQRGIRMAGAFAQGARAMVHRSAGHHAAAARDASVVLDIMREAQVREGDIFMGNVLAGARIMTGRFDGVGDVLRNAIEAGLQTCSHYPTGEAILQRARLARLTGQLDVAAMHLNDFPDSARIPEILAFLHAEELHLALARGEDPEPAAHAMNIAVREASTLPYYEGWQAVRRASAALDAARAGHARSLVAGEVPGTWPAPLRRRMATGPG